MKKIYEAPTMVSKKITVQNQLLVVSLSDDQEDINNIDVDPGVEGDEQLVKGTGIWDTDW